MGKFVALPTRNVGAFRQFDNADEAVASVAAQVDRERLTYVVVQLVCAVAPSTLPRVVVTPIDTPEVDHVG
ncbi:hypothetical protein [Lysobacter sp. CA199]|uniref:hypothetical protein n=1 Tax=Lysobacter sp. CA199 TaxID=3455608 RepID=UPI003F8D4FBA